MANFAPIVNTRGCIYTHEKGIVLRGTYYVFLMYVQYMGNKVIDLWNKDPSYISVLDKENKLHEVEKVDMAATLRADGIIAVSAINKDAKEDAPVTISVPEAKKYRVNSIVGDSTEAYNDINIQGIKMETGKELPCGEIISITLQPHSVNVIEIIT